MFEQIIRVPVICYHSIGTKEEKDNFIENKDWIIEKEKFEKQMQMFYKFRYKTITLDEFYNWKKGNLKLPIRSVLITFDDGYLNNYKYAFPVLKKYNLKATVFFVGSEVREVYNEEWKNEFKKKIPNQNLPEICKQYPNIEFACHSYDMHYEGALENKNYEDFLDDCNKFKKNVFETKYYAYPYGRYNENLTKAIKNTGFELAFTFDSIQRKVKKEDDDFLIPRIDASKGVNNLKLMIKMMFPFKW